MHWDREQQTSLPGCSHGPVFPLVRPLHRSSESRTPLTKHSTEQQLKGRARPSRAVLRATGFGFKSTATTQLCSADTCPGIHHQLPKAVSTSLQAQPHTTRQFSFCQLSSSCSQPEQNMPQGKPRDTSTSALHRNPSWDGWDSPASGKGSDREGAFSTSSLFESESLQLCLQLSKGFKSQGLLSAPHPTPHSLRARSCPVSGEAPCKGVTCRGARHCPAGPRCSASF